MKSTPTTPAELWLQQVLDEEIEPLLHHMHSKSGHSAAPRFVLLDRDCYLLFFGLLVFAVLLFTILLH